MRRVICAGAVLWDVIGRAPARIGAGGDVPGLVAEGPGGVAWNVAAALARRGVPVAMLGAVGADAAGRALLAAGAAAGVEMAQVCVMAGRSTDRYVALEDARGLVGAIADTATLEAAGAAVIAPLLEGRLGVAEELVVVVDGNLGEGLLRALAGMGEIRELRAVAASAAKGARLRALAGHGQVVIHATVAEAEIMAGRRFADAAEAAAGLVAQGFARAIITDGARAAADALAGGDPVMAFPPQVRARQVTGAGDSLLAAHLAAERAGADRAAALAAAVAAASAHVAQAGGAGA